MTRTALVVLLAAAPGCMTPVAADPTFEIPPPAGSAPADPAPAVKPVPNEAAPALRGAAPPAAADQTGRYSLHQTGDRFVRLDTHTGELSQCGSNAGVWSCKVVPDERAALDMEIARLQRENASLKKALLSRGLELPGGSVAEAKPPQVQPPPSAAAPVPPADVPDATPHSPKPPSEADLNRALAYMKHVWRKLVDMMLDLQRDVQRRI